MAVVQYTFTHKQYTEQHTRNRELEERLRLVETGKRNSVADKQVVAKCIVSGDSLLGNVGAEQEDMKLECFQGLILNSYIE